MLPIRAAEYDAFSQKNEARHHGGIRRCPLHRLLMAKGLRGQMEVQESYLDVLRMAASAAGNGGGGSGGAKPAHI
jgi:hypothetical protein